VSVVPSAQQRLEAPGDPAPQFLLRLTPQKGLLAAVDLVEHRRGPWRRLGGEPASQVVGEFGRSGTAEDQRRREPAAARAGQPVAEVDGGEGVEPYVPERTVRVHALRVAAAQRDDGVRPNEMKQELLLFGFTQRCQLPSHTGGGAGSHYPGLDRRVDQTAPQRRKETVAGKGP
jgi:hypothetical protein